MTDTCGWARPPARRVVQPLGHSLRRLREFRLDASGELRDRPSCPRLARAHGRAAALPVSIPSLPPRLRRSPLRPSSLGPLLGALATAGLALPQTPLHAAGAPEPEQAIRASYLCRGRFDALELTALFFNREPSEVILLVGETATRLPQQRAASGSRYAAGSQEFWIKGDQASWRLGPHPAAVMRCQTPARQSQR